MPLDILRHGKYEYTIDQTFKGITERYFRFISDKTMDISEVNLSSTYRFDNMTSRTSIHRGNNGGLVVNDISAPIEIKEDWEVTFPIVKAGKETFAFAKLMDWSTHKNEEIKYYSGTATYKKSFKVDRKLFSKEHKFTLSLGPVGLVGPILITTSIIKKINK